MPIDLIDATNNALLIFGASGHGRVVADAALLSGCWLRVIASDRDVTRCRGELLPGVKLIRPDEIASHGIYNVHVAIGHATYREREAEALMALQPVSIFHPHASVSAHAHIGAGSFVAARAVVAPGAKLAAGCIVNHGAVVDHDVRVGAFSHVAPGATLAGGVAVGARCLIGAGANVLPGVTVVDDVCVGAGAVVVGDLCHAGVYVGVPAKRVS